MSVSVKALYLCYFWLDAPLVQSQVLPYLREIRDGGVEVHLLTFEKDDLSKEKLDAERAKLAAENIHWHCLRYHKWPSVPATIYDIFRGILFTRKMIRRENLDVLHARIHVPMLMAVAARKLSFSRKPKIIFDIRGFFPEEYTDAGNWKENGRLYKAVKRVEKWLLGEADGFVVLTEKARNILFPESRDNGLDKSEDKFGRPVEVIPCCVDLEKRFPANVIAGLAEIRRQARKDLGLEDRLVIVHLGALGGLYRTKEIADFLAAARKLHPGVFAMFLTQTDPQLIIPLLKERGFAENDLFVNKVPPAEIRRYLSASDIALSFVTASYATLSRSPTKIPEYLACGLPVISNKGVGDVDDLINEDKVGVLLDNFSEKSYLKALEEAEILRKTPDFRETCRESAKNRFDLEKVGGIRYRRLYKNLFPGNR
jgi:glycosyltransferase involved in cell wall biosynthesis